MLPTLTSDASGELQRSISTSSLEKTPSSPSKKDADAYFDHEKVDIHEVSPDDDSSVKVIEKAEEVAVQVCAFRPSAIWLSAPHATACLPADPEHT